ncbi:MAG: hypothetical protein GXP49_14885 [Deltaproteobacteria bacterium]|nr:hypothetical protein [Deltaproteobacteria bacterium]
MAKDKWFEIVDDSMDDIPKRVEQLRSSYWKKAVLLMVLVVIGSLVMGVGKASGIVAIGCFIGVSGILGILAMATMCHTQLCMYRTIKEIRLQAGQGSRQTELPDKA